MSKSIVTRALVLIAVAMLAGCAAYKPVPDDYTGPKAYVDDSGSSESSSRAAIFALVGVDGNRISNSFGESARASSGRGFALTLVVTGRPVPARPMKALIRGSHTTAAPIHAIAAQMAGTYFSVEGEVGFEPKPDHRYVVKGVLEKGRSAVWIEDEKTGERVTDRVTEK